MSEEPLEEPIEDLPIFDDVAPESSASFLRAAVSAEKSLRVSGSQRGGKTTLLRALCAEIPPDEHIPGAPI